ALFVWLILRRLNLGRVAAWVGAALFAVHPIQSEAVAWAASMNTVLSGALSLAALWCYVEHATRKSNDWFIVATSLFVLAVFAKPSAVVVPLLAATIDQTLLRRPVQTWCRGIALWVAIAIGFAVIARLAQPATSVAAPNP